jgi:hypothetical protein
VEGRRIRNAAVSESSFFSVDYGGAEMCLAKEGKHFWVAVTPVCRAIGLDHQRQIQKLLKEPFCEDGMALRAVEIQGRVQEAWCVKLNYLKLWLNSINPNLVGVDSRRGLIRHQKGLYAHLKSHWQVRKKQPSDSCLDSRDVERLLQLGGWAMLRLSKTESRRILRDEWREAFDLVEGNAVNVLTGAETKLMLVVSRWLSHIAVVSAKKVVALRAVYDGERERNLLTFTAIATRMNLPVRSVCLMHEFGVGAIRDAINKDFVLVHKMLLYIRQT